MKLTQLFEAPISDFHHIGDFSRASGFRQEQDRRLITNPKALVKMKSMWKHPEEQKTNIIFVNHADGNAHTEIGRVNMDWLEKNMPRIFPQLEEALDHDALNIIYTNNKGSERVPMTGWILAHRLAHAIGRTARMTNGSGSSYYFKEAEKEFNNTFRECMKEYRIPVNSRLDSIFLPLNGPLLGLMYEVFTFKSARDRNIRNPYEALNEAFAQYIMTGGVKLNRAPMGFKYGPSYYRVNNDDGMEHCNIILDTMAYQLAEYFETCLSYCEGEIFVM